MTNETSNENGEFVILGFTYHPPCSSVERSAPIYVLTPKHVDHFVEKHSEQ